VPAFDYLVIGSGLAGLSFALKAAASGSVALVTKTRLEESNTSHAQGGIAAVWSEQDDVEQHVRDTLAAGAGLCDEAIVRTVASEGPDRIRELISLGVEFSRNSDSGDYDLALEGGHSQRRILHAADHTGSEIVRALAAAVRQQSAIQIFEGHHAVDLLIDQKFGFVRGAPQCWGAYVLDTTTNEVLNFHARATVLATGGAGKVYLYTSNPDVASGDGIAMAYRAGCRVGDLEFMQFHPTCLYHPQAKSFLITEAIRGEGAVLRRPDGSAFMRDYHPRGELAPRDIVARAIDSEMKRSGFDNVLLDVSHLGGEFLRQRFPHVYRQCADFGIDIAAEPIPVVPAAHYMCGGVLTDANGATAVGRLYAIGEVARTGMHGANRLASNSLLEAAVLAHRAYLASRRQIESSDKPPATFPGWQSADATDIDESVVITHNWDEIRRLMWNYVGVVRSDRRLKRAAARILMLREEIHDYYWDFKVSDDLLELRNLALVAELIIRCARSRRESRGLHHNVDCPETDAASRLAPTVI